MKIICGKDELLRGTQIIQTVVSPRSTLPILSNFLFETEGNRIKLCSTDLEVGVTCYIKGEIIKEGAITIPAKRFGDIVREMPDNVSIEITSDNSNQIDIKFGKSHFVLEGLPKNDYPIMPKFPEEKSVKIPSGILRTMLRRTSFAVSNDETRYVLNGVFVSVENGVLRFVATDGRRLAFISREGIDKKIEHKAIVPAKAVNEIQKILFGEEKEQEIKIGLAENQIAFQIDSITVISRLIEGTFPNYEQVIPKKHDTEIKISVKEALQAVRQMSILASDKAFIVKFLFAKNILKVSASSSGLGSGEVELDAEYSGTNLEIAFNPAFLIDILRNVDEDYVYFNLTSPLNPALIRPVTDKNYICVVMPMRV